MTTLRKAVVPRADLRSIGQAAAGADLEFWPERRASLARLGRALADAACCEPVDVVGNAFDARRQASSDAAGAGRSLLEAKLLVVEAALEEAQRAVQEAPRPAGRKGLALFVRLGLAAGHALTLWPPLDAQGIPGALAVCALAGLGLAWAACDPGLLGPRVGLRVGATLALGLTASVAAGGLGASALALAALALVLGWLEDELRTALRRADDTDRPAALAHLRHRALVASIQARRARLHEDIAALRALEDAWTAEIGRRESNARARGPLRELAEATVDAGLVAQLGHNRRATLA